VEQFLRALGVGFNYYLKLNVLVLLVLEISGNILCWFKLLFKTKRLGIVLDLEISHGIGNIWEYIDSVSYQLKTKLLGGSRLNSRTARSRLCLWHWCNDWFLVKTFIFVKECNAGMRQKQKDLSLKQTNWSLNKRTRNKRTRNILTGCWTRKQVNWWLNKGTGKLDVEQRIRQIGLWTKQTI